MRVFAVRDGLVEGTEVITVAVGDLPNPVSIFIIDDDCK